MDIFGTVATVLHQVHVTYVFIQRVVTDVGEYDAVISDMKARLTHELLFVRQFRTIFIDDKNGEAFFRRQDKDVQEDCKQSLEALRGVLAEYRLVAAQYGLDVPVRDDDGSVGSIGGDSAGITTPQVPGVPIKEAWLRTFNARMTTKMGELKRKAVNWSIFDKKNMLAMLVKVRDWMLRLRETVAWMLGAPSVSETLPLRREALQDMALQQMSRRQTVGRDNTPDPGFGPLEGKLDVPSGFTGAIGVAEYTDDIDASGQAAEVVFEVRECREVFSCDFDEARVAKDTLNRLAWMLHESRFQEDISPDIPSGVVLGLDFRGYLVSSTKQQAIFLYNLPPARVGRTTPNALVTLHGIINNSPGLPPDMGPQQSLGSRFAISHALAVSVLNIHASLWVHKNIRSSVLVMSPAPNTHYPLRAARPIPYITGWGIARPEGEVSKYQEDRETVSNLYRHPKRQGLPTIYFQAEHDIYSAGVVLVEIAIWQTVDQLFKAEVAGGPLSPSHFVNWWKRTGCAMVEAAMGEGYAEIVQKCLGVGVKKRKMEREQHLLDFRSNVVDVLRKGLDL